MVWEPICFQFSYWLFAQLARICHISIKLIIGHLKCIQLTTLHKYCNAFNLQQHCFKYVIN